MTHIAFIRRTFDEDGEPVGKLLVSEDARPPQQQFVTLTEAEAIADAEGVELEEV